MVDIYTYVLRMLCRYYVHVHIVYTKDCSFWSLNNFCVYIFLRIHNFVFIKINYEVLCVFPRSTKGVHPFSGKSYCKEFCEE